jgi:hypothetical protein
MKRMLTSLVLSLLLFAGVCARAADSPGARVDVSGEEYAVYSALINEMYVNERTEFLVVVDRTATESFIAKGLKREDIRKRLSPFASSAVEAFIERSARPETLEESFDLKAKYVLLGHDKRDEYFKPGVTEGWKTLEEKYPGASGFIRLAGVGFNPERDEALTYIEHGCGDLCGTGTYVLLRKSTKGWKVEKTVMLWIA